jgi:hypothetical protein
MGARGGSGVRYNGKAGGRRGNRAKKRVLGDLVVMTSGLKYPTYVVEVRGVGSAEMGFRKRRKLGEKRSSDLRFERRKSVGVGNWGGIGAEWCGGSGWGVVGGLLPRFGFDRGGRREGGVWRRGVGLGVGAGGVFGGFRVRAGSGKSGVESGVVGGGKNENQNQVFGHFVFLGSFRG